MMNNEAISAIKIADVTRPKVEDEEPLNPHVVPAHDEPEPDYDEMRRLVHGDTDTVGVPLNE